MYGVMTQQMLDQVSWSLLHVLLQEAIVILLLHDFSREPRPARED